MKLETERQRFARKMGEIKAASRLLEGPSMAERIAALPEARRRALYESWSPMDCMRLLYEWSFWARPKQIPPAWPWDVCLVLAGRAYGKSRAAAEWLRGRIERGEARSIAIVGPDYEEVRRYMVGGEKGKQRNGSGLLDVFPPWHKPVLKEEKGEIHFHTGAIAYMCSAEDAELRGPNLDSIWGDEPIKWRCPAKLLANIYLTLREKGPVRPQALFSTTPRTVDFLKAMILDPGTHTIHGFSRENANNLSDGWIQRQERLMGGTRQGAQELDAEMLGDDPERLFQQSDIDDARVESAPGLRRIAVIVDPAVSTNRTSDETGIVVLGLGYDSHVYVLADYTAKKTPEGWGDAVIEAYYHWNASAVIVERNKVGDMAAANVRAALMRRKGTCAKIKIEEVMAEGPKVERAKPIATLYTKGMIHHVDRLVRLEDEMVDWDPDTSESPNGLDALVHGVYALTGIGEDEKADPRVGFRGLDRAGQTLSPKRAPGAAGWERLTGGSYGGGGGRTI